jgi:hypothetical protein
VLSLPVDLTISTDGIVENVFERMNKGAGYVRNCVFPNTEVLPSEVAVVFCGAVNDRGVGTPRVCLVSCL